MDRHLPRRQAARRGRARSSSSPTAPSAPQEEDNLRHLVTNLGRDVPRERIVPFLTTKHPLDYCLSYAERAHQNGFPALVVLGGDKSVGAPRSVEHAWQLRELLRERDHTLTLGGWANPHADPERQVDFLTAPDFHAEFYLTQVVSHHQIAGGRAVPRGGRAARAGAARACSACSSTAAPIRETLAALQGLPAGAGRGPDARVRRGRDRRRGLRANDPRAPRCRRAHFYISNLPVGRAPQVLAAILTKAGALPKLDGTEEPRCERWQS